MQTFLEWQKHLKESSVKRQGFAHWMYPDGVIRSHYPDLYFTPGAADAIFKLSPGMPFTKKTHHVSHKTPPDYAIEPDGKVRDEKEIDYEDD